MRRVVGCKKSKEGEGLLFAFTAAADKSIQFKLISGAFFNSS